MPSPTISVIVPIYNVAEYLEQCLDSVLAQTFEDFELLLIDDGSTDASVDICDHFAKKDDRVSVVHQENRGLSAARNSGLRKARGMYVTFLDGDDWLDIDTLQSALDAAETFDVDVVFWPFVREYSSGSRSLSLLDTSSRNFNYEETKDFFCRRMVGPLGNELAYPEKADVFATATSKLYSRCLLERSGAEFVDLARIGTAEDALFNLQVLSQANNAYYLDQFFYHYRRDNTSSLTNRYRGLKKLLPNLHHLMASHIAAESLGVAFEQALQNRVSLSIIGIGLDTIESELRPNAAISEIREWLSSPEYQKAISSLDFTWFPAHWKLFFNAARLRQAKLVWLLLWSIQAMRHWQNLNLTARQPHKTPMNAKSK